MPDTIPTLYYLRDHEGHKAGEKARGYPWLRDNLVLWKKGILGESTPVASPKRRVKAK